MLDGTRQRVVVYHVVMASRKPKGIADDIVGGVRKIVSPWLGAPAGQSKSVTQAQGLARQAAEGLDQAFAGGMIKAGVQGNKALAKQAAVNAAALGVGYVAGKAVVTAASAVVKSGLPQRFINTVTRQKIMTHSSPIKNLKTLVPHTAQISSHNGPLVYGMNPGTVGPKGVAAVHRMYGEGGSLYLARVPTKNISPTAPEVIYSTKPVKVVKELVFPFQPTRIDSEVEFRLKEITNALKKTGVKLPKKK